MADDWERSRIALQSFKSHDARGNLLVVMLGTRYSLVSTPDDSRGKLGSSRPQIKEP